MINMPTDIEIAQNASLNPIEDIAAGLGISRFDLELYGDYKAKVKPSFIEKVKDYPNGKLILVTAINPTPAGEGKTTTTIGLGQSMSKLGKRAVIALREPSLGPVMGISCRRRVCQVVNGRYKLAFGICTPLPAQTIFFRLLLTITYIRETN